jgi:hypothetical protein
MNAEVSNARIITVMAVTYLPAMAVGFYWTPEYTEQLDVPQRPTAVSQNNKTTSQV